MKTLALLVALLSGCSLLAVQPLPNPVPPLDTYPQCTESAAPVALDLALGIVGGLVVGNLVAYHEGATAIAAVGAPTAALLSSGIYGGIHRARCKEARAAADRSIQRPY